MATYLITGANRGLGWALVRACLRRGHEVLAASRRDRADSHALPESERRRLRCFTLDVTSADSVQALAQELEAGQVPVDVLVNNAGIHPESGAESFETLDLSKFGEAFETNVVGVARVTRTILPRLRQGAVPRIVNISSGAGSVTDVSDHARYCYAASKAALNRLTRAWAHEFRPMGITVVAMSPGWVRTEMGGERAPLSPEASAGSMAETIERLTLEHTDQFLDREGNPSTYAW